MTAHSAGVATRSCLLAAMHRVFDLLDIVRLIADNIPDNELKSAVALACCHKSISIPTLDSLWERQTDFGTLLAYTLPPATWRVVNGVFDFITEPTEHQWARFTIYARRMRAIAEPRAFFPSQDTIKILRARFPAGSMLPLLRTLCWLYVPSEKLRSSVPLLVSPHLTYIRLHFVDNSPQHCLPILRTLTNAAGSLKSIELIPEFNSTEVQDAVSALLLSCNPNLLHDFCVASPISEAALLHAAQIPGLRKFSLRSGTPALSDPLPLTMFPSLESLLISVGNLSAWLEILRHIQSNQLKILSVDFDDWDNGSLPGDNNPLPMTLTHIQHSGIHKTLTELSLCPGSQWGINRISIEPLLVLRELTSLTIYTSCWDDQCLFSLSDRDLECLVKAMPKLETLSLGIPCAEQMHDNLTLKSLIAIATYCKALKTLQMHINCESIVMNTRERNLPGYSSTAVHSDYEGCQLRIATFGPCPIPFDSQGALLVAMTLLHLFPRLHEVRWTALETISPWSYVKTLIAEHSLVRLNLARFANQPHAFV